ncbi:hypothetical protein [Geobacillus sp. B4113_201601]|uniref:hypothetical protein n=1 Tax=Geobacillus sp. B4113_201601 TaxID=1586290 RepID=UPI000783C69D|nr:hypothetical protein [Geobacillus sp. B4113_201601]KYD30046.1 hypothetical protein B4113_1079 [Geobacillus sp. B4113_201601]
MISRIKPIIYVFVLALGFSFLSPLVNKAEAKVYWDGVELKPGQIGRLTVLKKTSLLKFKNDGSPVVVRTLNPGQVYRIYEFKPGYLGLGGGYYVKRDSSVKYETPSKTKLEQVRKENGLPSPQKPPINQNSGNIPYGIKTNIGKNVYLELQALEKRYEKGITREEFSAKLDSIYFKLKELKVAEPEKSLLNVKFMDVNNKPNITFNHMLVKFANGERFIFAQDNVMVGFNQIFGDKIYLKTQYLQTLYAIAMNRYSVSYSKLPSGISGYIQPDIPMFSTEKVYIDYNDINSDYYYVHKLFNPLYGKELIINTKGTRFEHESYVMTWNPYSIEDVFQILGLEAQYTYDKKQKILEFYFPKLNPQTTYKY